MSSTSLPRLSGLLSQAINFSKIIEGSVAIKYVLLFSNFTPQYRARKFHVILKNEGFRHSQKVSNLLHYHRYL